MPIGAVMPWIRSSVIVMSVASYVRKSSKSANAMSTTHAAHSDQASRLAVRGLIPALFAGSSSLMRVGPLKTDSPGRPPCRRREQLQEGANEGNRSLTSSPPAIPRHQYTNCAKCGLSNPDTSTLRPFPYDDKVAVGGGPPPAGASWG